MVTMPVPVTSWEASEGQWLEDRTSGLGGSDIAAVLGFSPYQTPWDVWAEKEAVKSWQANNSSPAAALGTALEPWIREYAEGGLGPILTSEYRTYAHPDFNWQRCSPDGIFPDGRLFEAKTAGLVGYASTKGWENDSVPLGYEFQVRWSMYVMDAPAVEVAALVAGMGVVFRTVTRDVAIELDLVSQITTWWNTHIVNGIEPALGAGDSDAIRALFPTSTNGVIDLDDTEAADLIDTYCRARAREQAAVTEKKAAGAALMALLGHNSTGLLEDQPAVTWAEKKGHVDWTALLADYEQATGVSAPDPEAYRKPSTRTLTVKDRR